MLRPLIAFPLALLAATPIAALSVSSSSCNGQSAELVADGAGTRLTVNGEEVALEEGHRYGNLTCVSRNDEILFGLSQTSGDEERNFLLDPETRELTEISTDEAETLGFWETEDDWFDEE